MTSQGRQQTEVQAELATPFTAPGQRLRGRKSPAADHRAVDLDADTRGVESSAT